jgi:FAD/FMN-containing dehydrogenase
MHKYLTQTSRYLCSWQHGFHRKAFKELEQKDVDHFRSILKKNQVITDSSELEIHNECFIKMVKGNSKLLLCPNNTQQVSDILRYCNQHKLAVVPQGGNTGLVGGSVPIFDEIILNLKNMNKIEKFDPVSSIVTVEAGVIL